MMPSKDCVSAAETLMLLKYPDVAALLKQAEDDTPVPKSCRRKDQKHGSAKNHLT